MGLYVHSLGEIPAGAERAYYVYLLDYGWEEPLGSAVRANLIPQPRCFASLAMAIGAQQSNGRHKFLAVRR